MQGQQNIKIHVTSVSVTTYLQYTVGVMLFPMANVLYSHISSSPSTCAEPSKANFCISLISSSTGVLLRYCLRDFEMFQLPPLIQV